MTRIARCLPVLSVALLSGCYITNQSALAPAGIQAERIRNLWLIFLAVLTLVYLTVLTAAILAARRGRSRPAQATDQASNHTAARGIALAVGISAAILIGLLVTDLAVGRAVASFHADEGALTIEVTGHQWWWEITYEDSVPERLLTTSNEIHIPVGVPVLIKTESTDVVHSFWLPNLMGKRDNTPGYTGMVWLRADKPGIYEGQCAEFCGHQHAKMRLTVVAESPARFAQWYESQRMPARPPSDSVTARGLEVFLAAPCVMCHTIRGTPAGGRMGPDLTHIGSQLTLGAGSLPNTRGHLAAWISDSQRIKPGNFMPPIMLEPADLHALLTYLESLK